MIRRCDLADIVVVADLITDASVDTPVQAPDVALHRFSLGSGRTVATDALIDFVVALEGLLLPSTGDNRELRYRFSLNGAVFLGTNGQERHKVCVQLREL